MCFGPLFLTWINLTYSVEEAEMFLEGFKSRRILRHRGVRQGCPLSPLLFNTMIETLATAVWATASIRGVQTRLMTHKQILYADDIVLLLKDPVKLARVSGDSMALLARSSGYKVNASKSLTMGLN